MVWPLQQLSGGRQKFKHVIVPIMSKIQSFWLPLSRTLLNLFFCVIILFLAAQLMLLSKRVCQEFDK